MQYMILDFSCYSADFDNFWYKENIIQLDGGQKLLESIVITLEFLTSGLLPGLFHKVLVYFHF